MILFFLYAPQHCLLTDVCPIILCVYASALFPNQYWVVTSIGKSTGSTQHSELSWTKHARVPALQSKNSASAFSCGASGRHPALAAQSAWWGCRSFASFRVLHMPIFTVQGGVNVRFAGWLLRLVSVLIRGFWLLCGVPCTEHGICPLSRQWALGHFPVRSYVDSRCCGHTRARLSGVDAHNHVRVIGVGQQAEWTHFSCPQSVPN